MTHLGLKRCIRASHAIPHHSLSSSAHLPLLSHEKQLQHCCWLRGMWRIWRVYFMCAHRVCVTGELPLKWTVQSQQQLRVLLKRFFQRHQQLQKLHFPVELQSTASSCEIWKLKCWWTSLNVPVKLKQEEDRDGPASALRLQPSSSKSEIFPLFHRHPETIAEEFTCRSS